MDPTCFFQPTPVDAKKWAKDKFNTAFPLLSTVSTPPLSTEGPAQGISPQVLELLKATLFTGHNGASNSAAGTTKDKDDGTANAGLSVQELQSTLIMCGKDGNTDAEALPSWFRACAEKNMTDAFRLRLIRTHITSNFYFDEAEVP